MLAGSSEYIDIRERSPNVNSESIQPSSPVRSHTIHAFQPYTLQEKELDLFLLYHFFFPTSSDLSAQCPPLKESHGDLEKVISAPNPASVELFCDGAVNPADLHRQADHAREAFDTGIEIKEEFVREYTSEDFTKACSMSLADQ